jgi:Cohesin domain
MRRIRLGAFVLALASITVVLVMTSPRIPRAAAQTGDAVLRVTGPTASVKKGDARVPFDITVENVKGLGSFQFDLTYDASVFELTDAALDAEKGDFLGSSGRAVVCNPPVVDTGAGVTRFTCVTLGATPAGVDGSGKLATIYLHAKGSGSTDITLKSAKLVGVPDPALAPADPTAVRLITFTTEGTSIKVTGGGGGMNWLIWGPVIAVVFVLVVGGAYAFMRMRSGSTKAATAV